MKSLSRRSFIGGLLTIPFIGISKPKTSLEKLRDILSQSRTGKLDLVWGPEIKSGNYNNVFG